MLMTKIQRRQAHVGIHPAWCSCRRCAPSRPAAVSMADVEAMLWGVLAALLLVAAIIWRTY